MMNSGKKPRMVISGDGGMNDDEVVVVNQIQNIGQRSSDGDSYSSSLLPSISS